MFLFGSLSQMTFLLTLAGLSEVIVLGKDKSSGISCGTRAEVRTERRFGLLARLTPRAGTHSRYREEPVKVSKSTSGKGLPCVSPIHPSRHGPEGVRTRGRRQAAGASATHALIEQDLYAAAGSSSADSEVSKIWQGIGRVMDGKHSRNSLRE